MRGFAHRDYHPNGQNLPKQASLGYSNLWVNVDTAVLGDTTSILLVSESEFSKLNVLGVENITLTYDGKAYKYHRHDPLTKRHVFAAVSPVPVSDVHEGQERMENEGGGAGFVGKPVLTTNKPFTADNWPIGGDRPDDEIVGAPGVETREDPNFAFPHAN